MAMYERFNIYVTPKTLVKLRDLFERERAKWIEDTIENGELICLWGELESRVQHLPMGIEVTGKPGKTKIPAAPVDDWLA